MKTAFKPRFVPSRTFTHDIVGRIDEYHFTRKTWYSLECNGESGIQSFFIPNNAKPHHRNHYALKVYGTLTEAVAAWQRQALAAQQHLAPPVRRICKFVIKGDRVRWGYQSCVASHVGGVMGWGKVGSWSTPWRNSQDLFAEALAAVDISGTINEHYDIRRAVRVERGHAYIYGDLHRGNVGFFQHRLVCIDFGTQSVDFNDFA